MTGKQYTITDNARRASITLIDAGHIREILDGDNLYSGYHAYDILSGVPDGGALVMSCDGSVELQTLPGVAIRFTSGNGGWRCDSATIGTPAYFPSQEAAYILRDVATSGDVYRSVMEVVAFARWWARLVNSFQAINNPAPDGEDASGPLEEPKCPTTRPSPPR